MLRKNLLPLFVIFLGLPVLSVAQKYNIINDTIRVSSSSFPFIRFLGEVQSANLLCEDYKIARTSTTITVRPKVSKPAPICMLIVSEGSSSAPRQHTFIVTYVKEVPAIELLHDYSTKALIEKRIEYLENAKSNPPADGPKGETAEKPKSKGGLFKKAPKVKAPDAPKVKAPDAPTVKAPDAPKVSKPETAKKQNQEKTADPETTGTAKETEEAAEKQESGTGSSDQNGSANDGDIKNIPADKLEERVKLKINSFYDACALLCAKTDIDESIKYGMKLFNNDESVLVETTNGKTNAKSQKNIRPYFNHLSQLKYTKVEMTTSEIRFVSNFHLGPDKKWHASAVVIQDFSGYKDKTLVFSDKTNKTIDIIVNIFDVIKDGKVIKKFDIFLGNISVTNIP